MLLLLLFLPLIGAALIGVLPRLGRVAAGRLALGWSLLPLLTVAAIALRFDPSATALVHETRLDWMPQAGIALHFGLEGIALVFVALTALITPLALGVSLSLERAGRGYFALVLLLEGMLFGVFTAQHFLPWFLCWELTLIPSYLLIRLWGGPGAEPAAGRFFVLTLGGSILMLIGFLALQLSTGTMEFAALARLAAEGSLAPALEQTFSFAGLSGSTLLTLAALGVFVGLAVKVPLIPFHIWLPAAYAEAPTPVTMLLTGLLSKMGIYAFVRIFLPIFPAFVQAWAPILIALALATIIIAALAALAQRDLKRILAYSSVNHLGYCLLALFVIGGSRTGGAATEAALAGIVFQAVSHGIIASALFCFIGFLERRTGGSRSLDDFGGIRSRAPVLCGLMGIALFASLGLPGLSGFIGEFLIFKGVFTLAPWAAAGALVGLLVTAIFLLRILRVVFSGPLHPAREIFADLDRRERLLAAAPIALIFLLGIFPQALLRWINADTIVLADLLHRLP